MRVAFISRSTLFTVRGGDTVQLVKTAEWLRKLGVEVDLYCGPGKISYERYDVIHGFNVIRPVELLEHFRKFKGLKVLSTIYVDYSEYELKARGGLASLLLKYGGPDRLEYLKTIARWVKNGEKNFSFSYLLRGHRSCVRNLLRLSDVLLPNSGNEYRRLVSGYGIERNCVVVPNAIDPTVFKKELEYRNKQNNLVLCVGRIDGLKNQLNLIRALTGSEFELLIIGKPAPNHVSYYNECRKMAGENVRFLAETEQSELVKYYQRAGVHVLPSWFETTGLSSLEAAAMGCRIVITRKGDTEDYFGDNAFYCEPDQPESILNAVRRAAGAPLNENFRVTIYAEYVWEVTARKTLQAYNNALSHS